MMQHMEERELEVKRYWNEVSDSEWYRSLRTEERLDRLQKDPKTAFYPGVLELMAKHVGDFRGKKILLPSSGDNHAAFAFALMGAQVTTWSVRRHGICRPCLSKDGPFLNSYNSYLARMTPWRVGSR